MSCETTLPSALVRLQSGIACKVLESFVNTFAFGHIAFKGRMGAFQRDSVYLAQRHCRL